MSLEAEDFNVAIIDSNCGCCQFPNCGEVMLEFENEASWVGDDYGHPGGWQSGTFLGPGGIVLDTAIDKPRPGLAGRISASDPPFPHYVSVRGRWRYVIKPNRCPGVLTIWKGLSQRDSADLEDEHYVVWETFDDLAITEYGPLIGDWNYVEDPGAGQFTSIWVDWIWTPAE